MSKIGNYILEAIDVMAQAKVDGLRFDKTVIGTIYSIVNEDTGEYKVQYQDSIFTAWSTNEKYKVGVSVYVKIPEGDFSNKKMIEGLSKNLDIDEKNIENLTNYRVDVGENRKAITPPIGSGYYDYIDLTEQEKYHIIKIVGEFTAQHITEYTGTFGLYFCTKDFDPDPDPKADPGIYTSFTNLDISGTPYNSYQFQQEFYIDISELLQQGYTKLYINPFTSFPHTLGNPAYAEANMISYNYVDLIDFTKINQYLYINKVDENTLKANLIVRAKSVIEDPNCAIYWYIRDQAAEGKTLAGYGWKELTDYRGKNEVLIKNENLSEEELNGLIKVITIYDGIQMEAQYQISQNADKLIIETTYSGDNAILTAKKETNEGKKECNCDWYYTNDPNNILAQNSSIYTIINYKKLKNDLHFLVKEANSNGTNN